MTRGRSTPRGRGRGRNTNYTRNSKEKKNSDAIIAEEDAEERKFLYPNRISQHLFCAICAEVFNKPFRAPCGHSFCFSCIEPWLKQGSACCPVDRRPVTMQQLHHDFILESIIGDYRVACPWRASGCSYVGPLCLLACHKKECVMNPDQLPEAIRAREKNNLKLQEMQQGSSATSLSTLVSSISSPTIAVESTDSSPDMTTTTPAIAIDASVLSDEEEDLPPPPVPSLLMRLYQKADDDNRNLMCSFLSEPTFNRSTGIRNASKRKRP